MTTMSNLKIEEKDKTTGIRVDEYIYIDIDYDDVNHYVVDELIPVIAEALYEAKNGIKWQPAIYRGQKAMEKAEEEELSRYN
jgi:hypothetical protein